MTLELLESIKRQTDALSVTERTELIRFLSGRQERPTAHSEPVTSAPEPAAERRRRGQAWLAAHRRKYGGRYVALDGDRLLGTGMNYPQAVAAARRAGVPDAYVDFVPPPEHVGTLPGWD